MSDQQKPNRNLILFGLGCAIAGTILAALLVCKHSFGEVCQSSFGCSVGGVDGCQELGASHHSKILGIPIAVPGLFYYLLLVFIFWKILREGASAPILAILTALVSFGLVFDAILGYINFRVLVVPCRLCAFSYLTTAGMVIATALIYMKAGKEQEWNMNVLTQGLKRIIPGAGFAAVGTMAVFLFLFVAGAVSSQKKSPGDLLPESEVSGRLNEFRQMTKMELSTDGLTVFEGEKSAYIIIHDFADFRCPHCFHAHEVLAQAMARWPGRIRIYYRHFPLDGSCNPQVGRKQPGSLSCNGAQASFCSAEQGLAPQMYAGIYQFQAEDKEITLDELKGLTLRLKGDWNRLVTCMGSGKPAALLARDLKDAETVKVRSTPTLVVADRLLPAGTPDPSYFMKLLDAMVLEKEGAAAVEDFRRRMEKK